MKFLKLSKWESWSNIYDREDLCVNFDHVIRIDPGVCEEAVLRAKGCYEGDEQVDCLDYEGDKLDYHATVLTFVNGEKELVYESMNQIYRMLNEEA